jgi:DNA primase
MGVTLSKPDKALWPNAGDDEPVSKLDLARYYEAVGEWMLHLCANGARFPHKILGYHVQEGSIGPHFPGLLAKRSNRDRGRRSLLASTRGRADFDAASLEGGEGRS